MVEFTYQMVLSTLQTIALIVGIAYYLIIMRNSQRNQQIQLETRQADLYLRLWGRWNTKEFSEQRYEAYRMRWTDRDDFLDNYSAINNPEAYASWNTFGRTIAGVAELWRKNLVDIEFLDDEMITDIINFWGKFGPLEKEAWEKGRPMWSNHFPFIKEVIDYDRRKRPWRYHEETGEARLQQRHRDQGIIWIQPEEIEQIRKKLQR